MYLLDSNILIYLLSGDERVKKFLKNFIEKKLVISIVSRMDVLIGAEKQQLSVKDAETFLDFFENIILDKAIVNAAVRIAKEMRNKLKFKDLVIAATANVLKMTILTADKDFKKIPGLKVQLLKV
ncbi:type II toxin-antitoxin system VapC family toxin [Candidatus Peregrinibacteria bacterium]|nr:type II toxin-antitoxin system VapC family toxin [Candidatus Peregrinibacteria bacterium]